MNDDLTHVVSSAQGEGPSEEFRARLRQELVARAAGSEEQGHRAQGVLVLDDARPRPDREDDDRADIPLIRLDDELTRRGESERRWPRALGAAAALIVAAAVGLWVLTQTGESDLDTVDIPTTTVPGDTQTRELSGELIAAGNTSIAGGTFLVDTLGTEVQFSADDLQQIFDNQNGHFSFAPFASSTTDDRRLSFRRVPFLPEPSTPMEPMSFAGGWPATDLEGWLAALDDTVVATEASAVELGGADAMFVELSFGCESGAICLPSVIRSERFPPLFNAGSSYQLWVVEQGEEDPIVVTAAIDQNGNRQWFEQAETILNTIEFGAVAPNPVRSEQAGSVELAVFDGIRFDLNDDVLIVEPYSGFARVLASPTGDIEMLTRPLDTTGVAVTSTDQVIGLLLNEAVVVEELLPVVAGGVPGRVFSIESGATPDIVLKTRSAELVRSEYGWEPPCCGHLWIFEHPERGLLIISAQRGSEFSDGRELPRSWVESMLRSLEFANS